MKHFLSTFALILTLSNITAQESNTTLAVLDFEGRGINTLEATTIIIATTLEITPEVTTLAGISCVFGSANGTGTSASFNNPYGVAVDGSGNVYVTDRNNQKIRKITSAGVVTTLAGSGSIGSANGTGTSASFYNPRDVAVDGSGNLYVADYGNHLIRKITSAGVVTTLAGSGSIGSANGTGTSASFYNPYGVAVDGSGNVYVADKNNHLIRKITSAGVVTTLAGSGSIGSANGTGTSASFYNPYGVAVDGSGNVYVADIDNHLIRKITSAGVVTTLAGSGSIGSANGTGTSSSFYLPSGVAVDGSGNVYVSDRYNQKIRKITSAGVVTTLAGSGSQGSANGTGTSASFYNPRKVAVDGSGNVYVTDKNNHLIRKIATTLANGSTTNDTTLPLIFTTSKPTTDFAVGDITVTNGALSDFSATSSTVYTATFTPTAEGLATIDVSASKFTDAAGNNNTAATQFTWTYFNNVPTAFEWVSSALDTINITEDNTGETYDLQWSTSTDADGDSINYLVYAKIGVNPPEEINDTTSTSVSITYEEFLENVFEPFPMLPRVTVRFFVEATDSTDTVKITGDDRVVFVNRYEYLSIAAEGIPTEFALRENYPNPFNPTTTLRFDLPEVSSITLTIYNMLGQKVKTFNMQNTPAGYHSVTWNATNDLGEQVGAGVYLYQLQTNNFVKTRKMVLLK